MPPPSKESMPVTVAPATGGITPPGQAKGSAVNPAGMQSVTMPTVTPPSPPDASDGPLESVACIVDMPELENPKPTDLYWIGTLPDSPVVNTAFAGVAFQRETGQQVWDGAISKFVIGNKMPGAVERLNESQVAATVAILKTMMVRHVISPDGWTSAQLVVRDGSYGYNPRTDLPAPCCVYMVKLGDGMPLDWRQRTPAPMMMPPASWRGVQQAKRQKIENDRQAA